MIREDFSELVSKSQMGDEQALIQLLLQAYSPISYLSRKILQNERTASQVTLEVLEILSQKLHSLDDTTQFESWVCRITAARCVQAMPLLHRAAAKSVSASRWDNTLEDSQILTEIQSAEVIQEMVDSLPEDQRLCILLISCCGFGLSAISQLTGFSASTVADCIEKGQAAIQSYLWEAENRGIQFVGISSLTEILHAAMFQVEDNDEAIPVVYRLLGKEIPVPPNPAKWVAIILGVVLTVLVGAFLFLGGTLIMRIMG